MNKSFSAKAASVPYREAALPSSYPLPRSSLTAPSPLRLTSGGEVDWVRKAQAGDRGAFEQLVRVTARMLYARLYVEIADPQRTEDLVQETYLTAWRSIGQLHDVPDASAFRKWLFSIARTVRIDSARHDGRKKRGGDAARAGKSRAVESADLVRDPSPLPQELMECRENQDRVLGLLRSLPDEYRLPISMRYLAGADYETVARQLGLTNGSLRGLLNRGMARLRQLVATSEE